MKRIIVAATVAALGIVGLTLLLQRGDSSFKAKATAACIMTPPTGTYAFSANGQLLRGNPHEGPVAWAGHIEFIPNSRSSGFSGEGGNVTGRDIVNYADVGLVERRFSGTYRIEGDCSVTVNFSYSREDPRVTAASASLYFTDGTKEFRMVQRDRLSVTSGSGRK